MMVHRGQPFGGIEEKHLGHTSISPIDGEPGVIDWVEGNFGDYELTSISNWLRGRSRELIRMDWTDSQR